MATITTDITAQDTVLLIDTPLSGFGGPYPWPITIDSEDMEVTGGGATRELSVQRGARGTVPAAHSLGATVNAGGPLTAVEHSATDHTGIPGVGGGGLPTGWTQDAADPANVATNGGNLTIGNANTESIEIQDGVIHGADSGFTERLTADIEGPGAILTLRPRTAEIGLAIDDSDGSESGIDMGGSKLINLATPVDGTDAARLDSLGDMAIYVGRPEVPAVPLAQDVVDALVALGLITQAAP